MFLSAVPWDGSFHLVAGYPYSVEQHSESNDRTADGTYVLRDHGDVRMYRDSVGRTRTEARWRYSNPNIPHDPTLVDLYDYVDGYAYFWVEGSGEIYRVKLDPSRVKPVNPWLIADLYRVRWASAANPAPLTDGTGRQRTPVQQDPNAPKRDEEWLPPQMMQGVEVYGKRSTTTYPIGYQGNDRPIAVVREEWTSPELGLPVLLKYTRTGEETSRLTKISLIEPDPALFQIPRGYKIIDETGDTVTLMWGN